MVRSHSQKNKVCSNIVRRASILDVFTVTVLLMLTLAQAYWAPYPTKRLLYIFVITIFSNDDLTYIDLSVNILNSLEWRFALRSGIFDLYNVLV